MYFQRSCCCLGRAQIDYEIMTQYGTFSVISNTCRQVLETTSATFDDFIYCDISSAVTQYFQIYFNEATVYSKHFWSSIFKAFSNHGNRGQSCRIRCVMMRLVIFKTCGDLLRKSGLFCLFCHCQSFYIRIHISQCFHQMIYHPGHLLSVHSFVLTQSISQQMNRQA